MNLKRRHLTQSQAAAAAVKAVPIYEDDAKKRREMALAIGRQTAGIGVKKTEDCIPPLMEEYSGDFGEAAEFAAEDFGNLPSPMCFPLCAHHGHPCHHHSLLGECETGSVCACVRLLREAIFRMY